MRRLAMWTGTVAAVAAAGALLGGTFGATLYRLSYDYIVVPADYGSLGLRLGLLVGAVLAAAQVVGHRPSPSPLRVGVALLVVGVVAVAFLGGAGWLSVELFEAGAPGLMCNRYLQWNSSLPLPTRQTLQRAQCDPHVAIAVRSPNEAESD